MAPPDDRGLPPNSAPSCGPLLPIASAPDGGDPLSRASPGSPFLSGGRVAGVSAILAGLSAIGVLVVQAAAGQDRSVAGALFNLLLLPVALYFWWRLGPTLGVTISSVSGVASLLLWATHLAVRPIGNLEIVWIWLSALWWLGLGTAMRPIHRRLGVFTLILALATIMDGIVSTPGTNLPFAVFALLGAWKIPLSFAWAFAVGVTLLRNTTDAAGGAERHAA